MGKISSYGIANEPSLSDKLIGTSVGSTPVNGTFNFTLQQLLNLFIPLIPSNTLQEVLDAGNTATQDITLSGRLYVNNITCDNSITCESLTAFSSIDCDNSINTATLNSETINTDDITINGVLRDSAGAAGTAGQVLSSTGTGVEWVTSSGGSTNIYNSDGTLTGNRVVTMGSYYLSFTKDLTVNGLTIGKGLGNILTNTALGNFTLSSNTTGEYNTAVGYNALIFNTEGSANIAIGHESLKDNTTGNGNISLGFQALQNNTLGVSNIAIGIGVLNTNTVGEYNIAIGQSALYSSTGNNNIAIGANTLSNNSTGIENTSIGSDSMLFNTTGRFNVALGSGSMQSNTTGQNNTVIGYGADTLDVANNNSIVIGASATGAGTNTVVLGNTSIVKTILRGTVNMANLPTSAAGLVSGDLWKNGTTVSIV